MKWIFTILVSIISLLAVAQNYSGMYPGSIYFYSNVPMPITMVREDTSFVLGNEFIRINEKTKRNISNEILVDPNCPFWGDPACQFKMDGPSLLGNKTVAGNNYIKYFRLFGDSLVVKFDIIVGDTQVVFQDTNNLVIYECVSRDTATIFGQIDSVIVFWVSHFDSLGNPVIDGVDGKSVIYSKMFGLTLGFSFDYFPYYPPVIKLEGIRNPNYGFYGLTYADIFDYQQGDLVETNFSYPPLFKKELHEVLNRNDSPTQVDYLMKVIQGDASFQTPPLIFTYDTVQINYSYSKTDYLDEINYDINGYHEVYGLNTCLVKYGYTYRDYNTPCFDYCPTSDCYGSVDCFGNITSVHTYCESVGINHENSYQYGNGYLGFNDIVYFNINGTECGSSYVLSSPEIQNNFNLSLFPNPTSNLITLQTNQIIQNGKIQLTDLSGRVVQQINFDQSLQIDLSHFSNGIYLIKLFSNSQLLSVQKLVKE